MFADAYFQKLISSIHLQGDHSPCAKPPVDFKTKVPLWPGQGRSGQNGTFVSKSTGGFAQGEWSLCIVIQAINLVIAVFGIP